MNFLCLCVSYTPPSSLYICLAFVFMLPPFLHNITPLWKIKKFSATKIVWNQFWWIKSVKTCHFNHFWSRNFKNQSSVFEAPEKFISRKIRAAEKLLSFHTVSIVQLTKGILMVFKKIVYWKQSYRQTDKCTLSPTQLHNTHKYYVG